LKYFLTLDDRPSALICFNDMMAIGVLQGLQQAGIRVPGEFSLTGFDNIVFSAYTNPPLTTFDQPKRFIGAEAARLVLNLLKATPPNDSSESQTPTWNRESLHGMPASGQSNIRMLKGTLLVRKTTARPAGLEPRSGTGKRVKKT
jgi:DNA-binding LacI/PurR family transcriptional regulator